MVVVGEGGGGVVVAVVVVIVVAFVVSIGVDDCNGRDDTGGGILSSIFISASSVDIVTSQKRDISTEKQTTAVN